MSCTFSVSLEQLCVSCLIDEAGEQITAVPVSREATKQHQMLKCGIQEQLVVTHLQNCMEDVTLCFYYVRIDRKQMFCYVSNHKQDAASLTLGSTRVL